MYDDRLEVTSPGGLYNGLTMFRVNLYRNQMAEGQEDYDKTFNSNEESIGEASEKHRRSIGNSLVQI